MEQLQAAWTAILDFLSKLIIPDWGGLIALLPVFVLVLILLWIGSVMRAFATAGPKQRGMLRREPVTPAGVHMPGPTYAPIFAAVGVALLFYGIVWGGATLALGFLALLLTLFYWLRLGMHDYDQAAGASTLPMVIDHDGPPPGVHVPGPTFLPVISALSVAILFIGVVVGGWVLAASVHLPRRGACRLAARSRHRVPPDGRGGRDRPPAKRAGAQVPDPALPVLRGDHDRGVHRAGGHPAAPKRGRRPGASPAPGGATGPGGGGRRRAHRPRPPRQRPMSRSPPRTSPSPRPM